MPQLKLQDGVGLVDADFNGSFVLECVSFQRKRVLALGPQTAPFPPCALCGHSNCTLRQRLGVVFVNLIDRGNQIVSFVVLRITRLKNSAIMILFPDSVAFWPSLLHPSPHC